MVEQRLGGMVERTWSSPASRQSDTDEVYGLRVKVLPDNGPPPTCIPSRFTDEVERQLMAAFPQAEVLVHQEPHGLSDERLDTRIAEAGRIRRGL